MLRCYWIPNYLNNIYYGRISMCSVYIYPVGYQSPKCTIMKIEGQKSINYPYNMLLE